MTTTEIAVIALGALNSVLLLVLLLGRQRSAGPELEVMRAEQKAQAEATREAVARSETAAAAAARELRTEVADRLGQLGESVRVAMVERIDAVAAVVEAARKAQSDAAVEQRTELMSGFGTLGDGVRDGLSAGATAQGERLDGFARQLGDARTAAADEAKGLREEVRATLSRLGEGLKADLNAGATTQAAELKALADEIRAASGEATKAQEALRGAVETRLDKMREENAGKLEEMRATVDEKLQGTLEARLGASFTTVNENLERVFRSVGEMQSLATGVGDLKRVLSNVKTRGIWGEGTLGTLIEQEMTPDQFGANVEVRPGSGERVEYAIRLPGEGDAPIWLPIDCKLPTEDYERLMIAADSGDAAAVEEAGRALERRIRACAKDISAKYIAPPHSTDFAVMFLPTEGLFAEVVRRPGLADALRREFRVSVAGPTTFSALLASLRMGFRTLVIQERSSEVWQVLGAVKTEFGKFGGVLDKVAEKLAAAQKTVEEAGVRRRAVDKKLRRVDALPDPAAAGLLAAADAVLADDADEG